MGVFRTLRQSKHHARPRTSGAQPAVSAKGIDQVPHHPAWLAAPKLSFSDIGAPQGTPHTTKPCADQEGPLQWTNPSIVSKGMNVYGQTESACIWT